MDLIPTELKTPWLTPYLIAILHYPDYPMKNAFSCSHVLCHDLLGY